MTNVSPLHVSADVATWQRHLGSFQYACDQLRSRLSGADYAERENLPLLRGLIDSLDDFSQAQLSFFINGFAEEKLTFGDGLAEEEYPPVFFLGATSRQIVQDLSVIERAIDQRRGDNDLHQILQQADVLALDALQRADLLGLEDVRPVTYLHKSPAVRVIPYAPVALIGIPYTAVPAYDKENAPQEHHLDYLGIAHEAGHYVYWHGRIGNKSLYQVLRNDLNSLGLAAPANAGHHLYTHWLEEIFADVYAALVGGVATTFSIQEVMRDNLPQHLVEDDGEHPLGVLRPFLYLHVLQKRESAPLPPETAAAFRHNWRAQFPFPAGLKAKIQIHNDLGERVGTAEEPFTAVRAHLTLIADKIIDTLGDLSPAWTEHTDLAALAPQAGARARHNDLRQAIRAGFKARVESSGALNKAHYASIDWPQYQDGAWQTANGDAIDVLAARLNRNLSTAVPNSEWLPIFQAGGWSSGGDDTYPNRP